MSVRLHTSVMKMQKKRWHSGLIFTTTDVFTAHFFIWLQRIILKAEKNQGLQNEEKNFILQISTEKLIGCNSSTLNPPYKLS